MKFFIVVSVVFAVARAGVIAPISVYAPATAGIIAATVPVSHHSSQYHSQDAFGQYSYGYASALSAKNEVKSADGHTVGSYSYVDPDGKLQSVEYSADAQHGFRVAATNLPVGPSPIEAPLPEPVKDTPEVAEARSRHLEALRQAEHEAKKAFDSVPVEVKSSVQAHPAVLTVPSVVRAAPAEVVHAAPIFTAPGFSYSFGIHHGGLYSVNSHQPIVTAYAAPGHFIAAPVLEHFQSVAEGPKQEHAEGEKHEHLEVVAARAKHVEGEKEHHHVKE